MDRPAVVLENEEAVYDFYLRHQQNRQVARVAYAALAQRFKPRVSYPDGAREDLRRLIYDDTRIIIAVNHLSETDPYTVAATAWASPLRCGNPSRRWRYRRRQSRASRLSERSKRSSTSSSG